MAFNIVKYGNVLAKGRATKRGSSLPHLSLQGLSDVGAPLRHVILAQLHVFLAVVSFETLHLLPMLLAVQHPAQSAQKTDDGQYNGRLGRCRQAQRKAELTVNKLTF